jgi:hypothetical protein
MERTLTLLIVVAGLLVLAGFWRVRLLLKD